MIISVPAAIRSAVCARPPRASRPPQRVALRPRPPAPGPASAARPSAFGPAFVARCAHSAQERLLRTPALNLGRPEQASRPRARSPSDPKNLLQNCQQITRTRQPCFPEALLSPPQQPLEPRRDLLYRAASFARPTPPVPRPQEPSRSLRAVRHSRGNDIVATLMLLPRHRCDIDVVSQRVEKY